MGNELFRGETVLITGAGSGIGKGIAERFADEGANLCLVDINEEKLSEVKAGLEKKDRSYQKINTQAGDLCEASFREKVIEQAIESYGAIHVVINSAGIYPSTPFLQITEAEWDSVLDLNLKAVFFLNQAAAKTMIDRNIKGRLVNISSTASEVARPGVAHYCSSKAGVKMLTQVLALELAPHSIRVNALGPGLVETDTLMNTLTTETARKEHEEKISYSPLNRAALVEEIADGVVYFASSQSSYVTGQTLLVDGGYAAGRIFKSLQ
ncbi:SDR family NAD(P)-dependent oxidoreductase [Bacillus sp. es.034]|uniref:SDR family NAD(P)-dependent oxidoreductase n=1 Tax=Bacillus sp. es.034 TaxID=1761763 RepID=UPI000BF53348|nr:SDR family NAD(P)-dependent oxidoreductase [Bacillus sp. es.034]PFG04513.1 3-oxoacyl-[acyl-carrier protein] reductase [Bacillus sp. es.034]